MSKLQLPFKFACVRSDRTGGRCQNLAMISAGGVDCATERWHDCIGHLKEEDPPMAPMPEWMLFQFILGWKAQEKYLEDSDIFKVERNEQAQLAKRLADAARTGRDPRHLDPERGYNGCPVFMKEGLKEVGSIHLLRLEIEALGYRLVNQHWYERASGGATLVCGFRKNAEPQFPVTQQGKDLFGLLLQDGWLNAHIHANPPDENGQVVHSIEFVGRRERSAKKNHIIPQFAEGVWWAEARESSRK
ncbi:MAG: hypothetical protein HYT37_01185 [Candidatus Sungbacteria bacterium]|nr:hypothetical protein [Candidatus Sungbacteria bacterium]